MKQHYGAIIIAAILAGSIGFFGGMKYQERKQPLRQFMFQGNNREFGGSMMRGPGGGGNRMGGRSTLGEIIAADADSITVKMQDGSSKIVVVSDTTTINKSDKGTKSDLKKGENVMVFGKENTDGSLTAQNIQLNPQIQRIEEKKVQN